MGGFYNPNSGSGGDPAFEFENYKIELERRLRHALKHIDVTQVILGLASSRIVATNSTGNFETITNLGNWIAGTSKQITVTNDGDGTISLSTPQDISNDASPTFAGGNFGNVSGGNYSAFESDGTLKFNGNATVFEDMLGQLITFKVESPSSHIEVSSAEGTLEYKTSCVITDYATNNIQMAHKWKLGSTISPHIHWAQSSATMPNWLIQYRWQRNGQSKTTAWTNIAPTSNTFTYASGTLNQITVFTDISAPSGYSISDVIQFRLIRDTANTSGLFSGADTLNASVYVLQLDYHYEADTAGSRTEYTK